MSQTRPELVEMARRPSRPPTRGPWLPQPAPPPAPAELLLQQLRELAAVAPDLVASELRPLVGSLAARRRACDQCGGPYLRKRFRGRGRFCGDSCRMRWYNSRRACKR